MSLGAERRMETRLKKLEGMIRDPRCSVNLESLLVSQVGDTSSIMDDAMLCSRWNARHVCTHFSNVTLLVFTSTSPSCYSPVVTCCELLAWLFSSGRLRHALVAFYFFHLISASYKTTPPPPTHTHTHTHTLSCVCMPCCNDALIWRISQSEVLMVDRQSADRTGLMDSADGAALWSESTD